MFDEAVDRVDRQFLSPPSARRATRSAQSGQRGGGDFYPRPPRGGRPRAGHIAAHFGNISIPALREEGDPGRSGCNGDIKISIPALREEGDAQSCFAASSCSNFYPRPPRGGRQDDESLRKRVQEFLSPPSARRATPSPGWLAASRADFYPRPPRGGRHLVLRALDQPLAISIPALREEGDGAAAAARARPADFYPRPPRGGRRPRG